MLVVRIPDWWKAGRPPAAGERAHRRGGWEPPWQDSLLDFKVSVSLEGEPLTEAELKAILQSTGGLALLKGKWVEVDSDKLQEVLNHWKQVQSATGRNGITLLEGMRLLSGFDSVQANELDTESARAEWSSVVAGEGLKKVLDEMQQPGTSAESDPAPDLHAELRPYQKQGAHWLWFMNRLGLGACLADDMGLGKTIQVLSLLLVLKRNGAKSPARFADCPGVADRQLEGGNPEVRAVTVGAVCASVGNSSGSTGRDRQGSRRGARGTRPGHHQLLDGDPLGVAQRDGMERGDPR